MKKFVAPSLDEFVEHGEIRLTLMGENPKCYKKALINKFLAWSDNDWYTLGRKPRKINNWKSTLTNSLGYLKAEKIEVIDPEVVKPMTITEKLLYGTNNN